METRFVADCVKAIALEFERAGLAYGHGTESAWDEAATLVAHAIGAGGLLEERAMEREMNPSELATAQVLARRRIRERLPLAYLVGGARFAGLDFKADPRALVPRSPIGELIENGFEPWVPAKRLERVLDLCTGGGCIAVAAVVHLPGIRVDAVDICPDALSLAAENAAAHGVQDRVQLIRSDLFRSLGGRRYDLIVTNPPYVGRSEYESLPDEYRKEPRQGLVAERDGLELVLRILAAAPDHLERGGRLIGEVGHGREVLERSLPRVPFLWLEFERGGEGVFLLEGDALCDAAADAASLLSGGGVVSAEGTA